MSVSLSAGGKFALQQQETVKVGVLRKQSLSVLDTNSVREVYKEIPQLCAHNNNNLSYMFTIIEGNRSYL